MNPSSKDLLIGALTIYGEARGDAQEGRVAVAHSILNRCSAKKWWGKGNGEDLADHTISAVCFKDRQYSCWNGSDPNEPKLLKLYRDGWETALTDRAFRGCFKALTDALDGFSIDHTKGCTHYLTTSLHQSGKAPEWSKRGDYVEIGKHRFFRGVA